MVGQAAALMKLKLMTAWVCPLGDSSLPEAAEVLEGLLSTFYTAFPEYADALTFSQSPRWPCHAFVYVDEGCSGLLPEAGAYLCDLLERSFAGAEVKSYGKWLS